MSSERGAQAWMLCDDIITRIKDELVLEAIDLLHEEMKAKRIDISGYTSLMPDRSSELQRDMFMINNLVSRGHEIMEQYAPYLKGSDEKNPEKLARMEDLKKFLLAVQGITMLMRYGKIAEGWALDTGKYSGIDDPVKILANTAMMADERRELLEYLLESKRFLKSEALSDGELPMLKAAYKLLPNVAD